MAQPSEMGGEEAKGRQGLQEQLGKAGKQSCHAAI